MITPVSDPRIKVPSPTAQSFVVGTSNLSTLQVRVGGGL